MHVYGKQCGIEQNSEGELAFKIFGNFAPFKTILSKKATFTF